MVPRLVRVAGSSHPSPLAATKLPQIVKITEGGRDRGKPKSTEEPESPRRIRPTQSICTRSGNIIWTRLAQRAVDSWLGDDLGTAHPCPLPGVELPEVIETARQCSSRLTDPSIHATESLRAPGTL